MDEEAIAALGCRAREREKKRKSERYGNTSLRGGTYCSKVIL
jgi:hypothetical protein